MGFYGVTTAVSETLTASGTVSVDVADPSVLTVGRKLTIRPQGVGEFQGVTVSRRSHRALVNSISGGTVSLTLGQDGTAGRIIKKGDILDQTGEQIYAEVDDHEGRITALEAGVPAVNVDALQQLLTAIFAVCGPDVVRCWMPDSTLAAATQSDQIASGVVWTYPSTPAGGRYSSQGNGVLLSFNGTDQYLQCPDAGDLSFVSGGVDQPFSVFVVGNITNTAAARILLAKYTTGGREWAFFVAGDDSLRLVVHDESSGAEPRAVSSGAVTMGALASHAGVYSAQNGGAAAANDMALFVNGSGVAVTATNAAGYVQMENGTAKGEIGADQNGTIFFLPGSLGLVLLVKRALTRFEVGRLHKACQTYFVF